MGRVLSLCLKEIVDALGGDLRGDPAFQVDGLAALDVAGPTQLGFLSHPRYAGQLASTRAGCVIVSPAMADAASGLGAAIIAADPYLYFARVTQLWRRRHGPGNRQGVHPSAVVDPQAFVDPTVSVGALCIIERGARIGAGSVLKSRVTVSEGCTVGERCILHPGVVIGADGFGFAPNDGAWEKIEQLGAVRIGDDVEIGANTCIDRGALSDTVIGNGVKIDNLVQIGHNVRIGDHSALAGCAGVAGSATIGAHCTVGGGAVVLGHLFLADGVHVSAASVVTRSITAAGHYSGFFPIDDNASWEKNAATVKQLHSLRERIKALEKSKKP